MVFKIIDGKLYLNWSVKASEEFETEAYDNIQKADANWENLQKN
jgi:hypothetical protein